MREYLSGIFQSGILFSVLTNFSCLSKNRRCSLHTQNIVSGPRKRKDIYFPAKTTVCHCNASQRKKDISRPYEQTSYYRN